MPTGTCVSGDWDRVGKDRDLCQQKRDLSEIPKIADDSLLPFIAIGMDFENFCTRFSEFQDQVGKDQDSVDKDRDPCWQKPGIRSAKTGTWSAKTGTSVGNQKKLISK